MQLCEWYRSLPLRTTTRKNTLNIVRVQIMHCVDFDLNVPWYGSIEWNMEKILVWNEDN